MKTFICIILVVILSSFVFVMDNENNIKKSAIEIEIIDTVKFEGMMILDGINSNFYFVEAAELPKIKTQYKSKKEFIREFKNVHKVYWLQKVYLKNMLEKYNNFNCEELEFEFHNPSINGITVYEENGKKIIISLLNIRLVKTKIHHSILKHFILEPTYPNNMEYITFYSFLFCYN